MHRLAEEEISFTRLRARCDVMADRADREQGQPTRCPRRHSLINRIGPCSRTPSGPAVSTDCINRPDRRLHPTMPLRQFSPCNAGAIYRGLKSDIASCPVRATNRTRRTGLTTSVCRVDRMWSAQVQNDAVGPQMVLTRRPSSPIASGRMERLAVVGRSPAHRP